jgi:hypothetical protein
VSEQLKAYSVQELDERTGDIFYAKHAITARKRGANEYAGGEITGVECRRAPWADKYAPGPCPRLVMIDHGWWFECHGCGQTMREDAADYVEEGEVNDPARYIERGSSVYCSEECRTRYRAEKALCKRMERKAVRELADKLLAVLPGVTPITIKRKDNWRPHAYASRQRDGSIAVQQCVVSFEWPGMKIGAGTYRYDKVGEEPHVAICHGDLEAWHAWRDSVHPPADRQVSKDIEASQS